MSRSGYRTRVQGCCTVPTVPYGTEIDCCTWSIPGLYRYSPDVQKYTLLLLDRSEPVTPTVRYGWAAMPSTTAAYRMQFHDTFVYLLEGKRISQKGFGLMLYIPHGSPGFITLTAANDKILQSHTLQS
jgi:hypothetical protein